MVYHFVINPKFKVVNLFIVQAFSCKKLEFYPCVFLSHVEWNLYESKLFADYKGNGKIFRLVS